jgi:hypothetical protein
MHIYPEQRQSSLEQRRMEQQQNMLRRLRSLPQAAQQPYDWIEFRRRAQQRVNAAARREAGTRTYLAIAAALVLVVVGIAAWMRGTRPGADLPVRLESADSAEVRTAAAERWLASLPSEPAVVHVGTRAAVTGLEDQIAQLDDFLSAARVEGVQPAKLVGVEERRALLVKSLVQVRYAETLVSASR